jgi:ATP-dependent DNA helicase RecG
MDINKIKEIFSKGETEEVEFKKSTTQLKKGIISIVAILNKHKKGKLFLGVLDDGTIVGQDIGKNTLRDISKAISENIEPKVYATIDEVTIEKKQCIVVDFKGEDVPYFAYGRAYMRMSDEDLLLSKAELEKIIIDINHDKFHWDTETNEQFTLEDIYEDKLKKYISKANLEYTTKEEVLDKLNLMKNGKLTNASIILFGVDVKKYFHLINLRCATFIGTDKGSGFTDMTDFDGDLFELIEKAEAYIIEHINVGMKLDGLRRINVPEINRDAFREAIINAFCHRDYYINQEVQIAIFRDRIEILNPGNLYAGLTIDDILTKRISKRRNSLIADIFHNIDLIEKWGSGIKKMKKLEPTAKFEIVCDFFQATFERKVGTTQKTTQKTTQNMSERIIELLKQEPTYSRAELAYILKDITEDGVKYHLDKLKKSGRIKRIGSDRSGHWEILI